MLLLQSILHESYQAEAICFVLQQEGEVTYNGRTFDEFRPYRTAAYISQEDVHMGELTVRETFDFAARCMGAGTKASETPLSHSPLPICMLASCCALVCHGLCNSI